MSSKKKDKRILIGVTVASVVIIVGCIVTALVFPGKQMGKADDREEVTTIIQNDENGYYDEEYASATARNIYIQDQAQGSEE